MGHEIRFTIEGEPVAKGRPRFARAGHTYTPKKTVDYEKKIKKEYSKQCGKTITDKEVEVEIYLYFQIPKSASKKQKEKMRSGELKPMKRPDIDNCSKIILDGLNKVAYLDDKQVIRSVSEKWWSEDPRTEVIIRVRG